jgi:hypothetical protein
MVTGVPHGISSKLLYRIIHRTAIERQQKMFYFCSTTRISRRAAFKPLTQRGKMLKFRKSQMVHGAIFWFKNRATFPEFWHFAAHREIQKESP